MKARHAVMHEGQIMGIVDPATTTREEVGLVMAGVGAEAAWAEDVDSEGDEA